MNQYEENKIKYEGDKNKAFIATLSKNSLESFFNIIKRNKIDTSDFIIKLSIESDYYNITHTEIIKGG